MPSKLAWVLLATLGLAGCHEHPSGPTGHDHGHGDPDKAVASLTLDNGKKWQTDATLRAGMASVRDQLQAAVQPIHAKTFSPEQYAALATGIDKELGNIVTNCKLPHETDARFHVVLSQMTAGTALMRKDGDRMAGAVKVIQGLESYGTFFEHPDWKPIVH